MAHAASKDRNQLTDHTEGWQDLRVLAKFDLVNSMVNQGQIKGVAGIVALVPDEEAVTECIGNRASFTLHIGTTRLTFVTILPVENICEALSIRKFAKRHGWHKVTLIHYVGPVAEEVDLRQWPGRWLVLSYLILAFVSLHIYGDIGND